ncbi:MAG: hypothetical protein ACLS29_08840 [Prevotellamassilia sp.]
MEHISIITAPTPTGLCGTCDLLPAWIVASEGSLDEFKAAVKESIDFYLECAREDHTPYPDVFDGEWELSFVFDVRAVLCYLRGLMTFSALERITGINQKQLAHYAAGRSHPRAEQRKKIVEGLNSFGRMLSDIAIR